MRRSDPGWRMAGCYILPFAGRSNGEKLYDHGKGGRSVGERHLRKPATTLCTRNAKGNDALSGRTRAEQSRKKCEDEGRGKSERVMEQKVLLVQHSVD